MFTRLNKTFKTFGKNIQDKVLSPQKLKSSSGQIAIILIFVTAIVLILYAVVLNLNRVSQVKTFTTVAANVTAAQLGSLMASYGESIFRTSLGGRRKICGFTGVFAAILTVVIIIIAIIVAVFTPGGGALILANLGLVIVIVVLAVAAVVLQMTSVNPGLTKLWNKMMSAALVPADQFLERGIQSGLQSVTNDQVRIVDIHDTDLDRVYVGPNSLTEEDHVGRFGYHYTERLKRYKPLNVVGVQEFRDGLFDLIYLTSDIPTDFGLYDEIACGVGSNHPCCHSDLRQRPSVCNPCCVPRCHPSSINPCLPTHPNRVRDESCDALTPQPETFCAALSTSITSPGSPFGSSNPFIYEHYYDNQVNGPFRRSFRELIGRDDQHRMFRKNSANPSAQQASEPVVPQVTPTLITSYRIEDRAGYHPADATSGVYGVLHKIKDWELDLATANTSGYANKLECQWTDSNYPGSGGLTCPANQIPTAKVQQLVLPGDPAGLPFNRTAYVDGRNTVTNSNIRPDLIGSISNLIAADNECAWGYPDTPNHPSRPSVWKQGQDKYCSVARGTRLANPNWAIFVGEGDATNPSAWPYSSRCPKSGTWGSCRDGPDNVDCTCREAVALSVPNAAQLSGEDSLDDMVYGMAEFIDWGVEVLSRDLKDLVDNLESWYPQAADWIEPIGGGYMNNNFDGGLWVWYYELQNWQRVIDNWINTNWMAGDWREAWCAYDQGRPIHYRNTEEEATWSGNEVDVNEVIACLRWNAYDQDVKGSPSTTLTGNYEKFLYCYNQCGLQPGACDNLPRSLVPNFNPTFIGNADKTALQNCKNLGDSNQGNWVHAGTKAGINDALTGSPPVCSGAAFAAVLNRVLGRVVPYTAPRLTQAQIAILENCASCQGNGGTCGVGTYQVSCDAINLQVNLIEAAKRALGGYGSCWSWSFTANRFYAWGDPGNTNNAVISGNPDYYTIMNAMGTCPYKSVAGNSFTQAMLNAFPTADPAHQAQFIRCETGCNIFHPQPCSFTVPQGGFGGTCQDCVTLPYQNAGGTQYNLEPFFQGVADPVNDVGDIVLFFTCLTGSCTGTECSAVDVGGPLPLLSSDGTPYYPSWWGGFIPPNDPNALAIAAGYDGCAADPPPPSCEGAAGVCGPGGSNAGLPRLTCSDANLTKSLIEQRVCEAAGSFCDPWQNLNGGSGRSRHFDFGETGNAYWDDIVLAEATATGTTCLKAPESPYMRNIRLSYEEAQFQVAKFQKRLDVLEGSAALGPGILPQIIGPTTAYPNLWGLKTVIDQGVNAFRYFLEEPCDIPNNQTGPAQCLTQAMNNISTEIALSRQAVYAWQSEPEGDEPKGTWHVARVDVRLPRRCDNACGSGGAVDPPWPWVHTYTKRWGTRRCYELYDNDNNVRGMVKTKITRFDEGRTGSLISFPGGFNIWRFRFNHPLGGAPNLYGAADLDEYIRGCDAAQRWGCCEAHMNPSGELWQGKALGDGAFLLDRRDTPGGIGGRRTIQCWDAINALLKHGVSSDACAEYYFAGGQGFNVKFVPCANF